MQLSIASYELYRLQDWIDALETVKTIETGGIEALQARRN